MSCPTELTFRPNGTDAPATLLYSFEGSGNTWLREMLENTTGMVPPPVFPWNRSHCAFCCPYAAGIPTGGLYFDKSLSQKGFIGEGVSDNTVLVVKSHLLRTPAIYSLKRHEPLRYDKVSE